MTSQSNRNVAVMAAIHTHYLTSNGSAINPSTIPEKDFALVVFAPLIAGAIVVLAVSILLAVCCIMREKQKRIQEAVTLHELPWVQTLEVYTLCGRDASTGMFLPPIISPSQIPPPSYDLVVQSDIGQAIERKEAAASIAVEEHERKEGETNEIVANTDDLPSYEAAINMDGKK